MKGNFKMLNIKEVARHFHVSPQTVRAWVRSGQLKCFHLNDVYRFSEQHIQAFIAENERQRSARGTE